MGIILHVENLSAHVTDDDLIVRFGDYGIVESAMMDRVSPHGMQSACVVMANSDEASAVIDWLHDMPFKGSTISVVRVPGNTERSFWLHLDIPRGRPRSETGP